MTKVIIEKQKRASKIIRIGSKDAIAVMNEHFRLRQIKENKKLLKGLGFFFGREFKIKDG